MLKPAKNGGKFFANEKQWKSILNQKFKNWFLANFEIAKNGIDLFDFTSFFGLDFF